jgi:hypothetical protein
VGLCTYLEADAGVRMALGGGLLLRWPQAPHRGGEAPHGGCLLLGRGLVAVPDAPSKLRGTGPAAGGRCGGDGGFEQAAAAAGGAKRGGGGGGARHCGGLGFRRRCEHGGEFPVGGGGGEVREMIGGRGSE